MDHEPDASGGHDHHDGHGHPVGDGRHGSRHRNHNHNHADTDTDTAADELQVLLRPCAWCAAEFVVIRKPGRPRIYCNHTCRQRAYEHRHGFRHQRTVRPLPAQAPGEPTLGTGYERGGWGIAGKKIHAMRTSVRPHGRLRETLCGHLIVPRTGYWFMTGHPHACTVCTTAALAAPLHHPISPSNELARLRAIIDEAIEQRLEPTTALAWMAANAPPPTPTPHTAHAA